MKWENLCHSTDSSMPCSKALCSIWDKEPLKMHVGRSNLSKTKNKRPSTDVSSMFCS
ncbi:hypothetical protein EVA_05313 [gut metagenome]|uniref:Uncharacterized protein n=1 Tax=gut metagenome TaxID=749906 RepID=J9D1W4_9ZZZZ